MINRIIKIFKNPKRLIISLGSRGKLKFLKDITYLKIFFSIEMGNKLDFKNPTTYNEKLQWLKIYDRNPIYKTLVDKLKVREYIRDIIGEEYLVPLIADYNKVSDIKWDNLPDRFVLKCTHGTGSNIVCANKNSLDIKSSKKQLKKWMKKNWFWPGREWPYKNLKPRIICEEFLTDDSGLGLKDYKFFCFNGEPKAMFIASDRGIDTRFDFFDINFNHLPFKQGYKNAIRKPAKPKNFDKMVEVSKILSKKFPHVRVDFYESKGKIYFSELTLYHFSGVVKFEPYNYDIIFGSWINLEKAYNIDKFKHDLI